tara:strand:- start:1956 stop:2129 length:174 start_codon:yes stop_codon:yes gene_type:complete
MSITKAQYQKTSLDSSNTNIKATIDGKELYIPLDSDNRHYIAVQEWVAKGNKIEDAE